MPIFTFFISACTAKLSAFVKVLGKEAASEALLEVTGLKGVLYLLALKLKL
ncbi:MAG: hypothetical protein ACP5FU_06295 [Nitrososphaeria archaeon]